MRPAPGWRGTSASRQIGERLAAEVISWYPTAVLSPALGGVNVGDDEARALGTRAIFAERQDTHLTLRRGFTLDASDRVLIVEDVVTTGLSTQETIAVARSHGATVVGCAAIVDRSDGAAQLGVPFVALLTLHVPAWQPSECPLCQQELPISKPGSRPASGA